MASDAHAFNPEEFKAHIKKYWVIFGALMVLTLVTVAVSYLELGTLGSIVLALIVATVKGTLVALFFMHLIDERKLIYWTLLLCAVLAVPLFALPSFTDGETGEHRIKMEAKQPHGKDAHGKDAHH